MPTESIEPSDLLTLKLQIAELEAKLAATRPVAANSSGSPTGTNNNAQGERSALVAGSNSGTINTGTQIVSHYHSIGRERLNKEEIARRVTGYLSWLRDRTQSIELRGIERAGGAPVVVLPLETAYVPLRAKSLSRVHEQYEATHAFSRLRAKFLHPELSDDELEDFLSEVQLNEVLNLGKRLVIVGGPGSGKTTVLLHIAWAIASSLLSNEAEPVRSRLGLKLEPSEMPLPIFVPLASFARFRRNHPSHTPPNERTLAYFISHHLISRQADLCLPSDFFVQLIENGRDVILLLDGLDEVANEDERAEVRQSVEDLVSGRADIRVVITCRTIAYRAGRTALGADFQEITVQPLDRDQHIAPMVRQAYSCIFPSDPIIRNDRIRDLLGGIDTLEKERSKRLGRNAETLVNSPLMVRLLLIVHVNNRKLPDERADLFDKAINALLQVDYGREERDIRDLSTDWKIFREMAQHLAFHLHQQGRDQGREIDEVNLKIVLRQEPEFQPHIEAFLSHARHRGSVLEERNGVYRFIHLAFQEFLVARYLREVIGSAGRDAILEALNGRLLDPWWREPVLLFVSYLANSTAKPARDFLVALANAGSSQTERFSAVELAGIAALEWRESGEAVQAHCAHRIVDLLNEADTVPLSHPILRARVGDVLGKLGDPRFDPQQFYLPADNLLGFVRIPANPEFIIGTNKADAKQVATVIGGRVPEEEINDHRTPTSEFFINQYLVTVAQFKAFVRDTGFKISNTDAFHDLDSRPVRWVNWFEAMAYCKWLNCVLGHLPAFDHNEIGRLVRQEGWYIALPNELEWETAARGGRLGTIFPWGNDPEPNLANCAATRISDTSVVGVFPANEFGLRDMIGNVWEWTCSSWGLAYPYEQECIAPTYPEADGDGDIKRIVRGGSWSAETGVARCAYRGKSPSRFRGDYFGFRVVLRSSCAR